MGLIVTVIIIVLIASLLVALAWWRFSDAIFPGSREHVEPANPHAGATVIPSSLVSMNDTPTNKRTSH